MRRSLLNKLFLLLMALMGFIMMGCTSINAPETGAQVTIKAPDGTVTQITRPPIPTATNPAAPAAGAELIAQRTQLLQELFGLRNSRDQLELKIADAQKSLTSLNGAKQQREEDLKGLDAKERADQASLAGIQDNLAKARTSLAELQHNLVEAQQQLDQKKSGQARAQVVLDQLNALIKERQQALSGLERTITTEKGAVDQLASSKASLQGQSETLQQAIGNSKVELSALMDRRMALQQELDALKPRAVEENLPATQPVAPAANIATSATTSPADAPAPAPNSTSGSAAPAEVNDTPNGNLQSLDTPASHNDTSLAPQGHLSWWAIVGALCLIAFILWIAFQPKTLRMDVLPELGAPQTFRLRRGKDIAIATDGLESVGRRNRDTPRIRNCNGQLRVVGATGWMITINGTLMPAAGVAPIGSGSSIEAKRGDFGFRFAVLNVARISGSTNPRTRGLIAQRT